MVVPREVVLAAALADVVEGLAVTVVDGAVVAVTGEVVVIAKRAVVVDCGILVAARTVVIVG